jgi:hypothetical protein
MRRRKGGDGRKNYEDEMGKVPREKGEGRIGRASEGIHLLQEREALGSCFFFFLRERETIDGLRVALRCCAPPEFSKVVRRTRARGFYK